MVPLIPEPLKEMLSAKAGIKDTARMNSSRDDLRSTSFLLHNAEHANWKQSSNGQSARSRPLILTITASKEKQIYLLPHLEVQSAAHEVQYIIHPRVRPCHRAGNSSARETQSSLHYGCSGVLFPSDGDGAGNGMR